MHVIFSDYTRNLKNKREVKIYDPTSLFLHERKIEGLNFEFNSLC